ncbi:MAG: 50S ribosomal protein L18 [Acidimicrobiales bacterium]|nr:50S ribosomal protein L18 [Acidimicrobiales bacterium]
MGRTSHKLELRRRRHARVRRRVRGTAERPRLSVFRSIKHISAQLIDDANGRTVAAASSVEPALRDAGGANVESAKAVGALLAVRGKEAGVTAVVFDRGGFAYHGRVAALADAARAEGLEF